MASFLYYKIATIYLELHLSNCFLRYPPLRLGKQIYHYILLYKCGYGAHQNLRHRDWYAGHHCHT